MTIDKLMKLVKKYAEDYRNVDAWSGKVTSSTILNKAYTSKKELMTELEKLINNQEPKLKNISNLPEQMKGKKYNI